MLLQCCIIYLIFDFSNRFDREISMEPPNAADRYALFQAQINKMPLDDTVDIGEDVLITILDSTFY
jgi:ATP-dependent 26S proteasome regulatory subunit